MIQSHKFAIKSFEDTAADLERACAWLSSLGCALPRTRIGLYQRDIVALAAYYNSDNVGRLTGPGRFEELLNSIYEATELISIHRGLESHTNPSLVSKLKELTAGPIYGGKENSNSSSNKARNTSYELLMAARLAAAGYDIDLSTEADIIARKDDFVFYVECKRPQSADGVNSNLKAALRQLRTRYEASDNPAVVRGIVALSINKAVPVAPRVLKSATHSAAGAELARVVEQFRQENEHRWRNVRDGRTIGVLLDFRALIILDDMNLITTGQQCLIEILRCSRTDGANMHSLWSGLQDAGRLV